MSLKEQIKQKILDLYDVKELSEVGAKTLRRKIVEELKLQNQDEDEVKNLVQEAAFEILQPPGGNKDDEDEDDEDGDEGEVEEEEKPAAAKKSGKSGGATKRARAPAGKPKKGRSAYIIFSTEKRDSVKAENPGLSFAELNTMLGAKWKELPEDEKKTFNDRAAEEKKRQDALIKTWQEQNPDAEPEKKKGKGGGKDGAAKAKKDPNMPKKGRTPYIIFATEKREDVKRKHPELKPKELMAKMGEVWNKMSPEEKKEFEVKALEEKKVQDALIAKYLDDHPEAAAAATTSRSKKTDNEPLSEKEQELQNRIDRYKGLLRDCGITVRDLTSQPREDRLQKLISAVEDNELDLSWSRSKRETFKTEREAKRELEELNSNDKLKPKQAKRAKTKVNYAQANKNNNAGSEGSSDDDDDDGDDDDLFSDEGSD